jgi:hypothetical protein
MLPLPPMRRSEPTLHTPPYSSTVSSATTITTVTTTHHHHCHCHSPLSQSPPPPPLPPPPPPPHEQQRCQQSLSRLQNNILAQTTHDLPFACACQAVACHGGGHKARRSGHGSATAVSTRRRPRVRVRVRQHAGCQHGPQRGPARPRHRPLLPRYDRSPCGRRPWWWRVLSQAPRWRQWHSAGLLNLFLIL